MASSLTTTQGIGTQASTDSPQNSTTSGLSGEQSSTSSVQQGTASTLLNNTGGIPLTPTPVSTVNVNATAATSTVASTAAIAPVHHHVNDVLLGGSVILFVVAIVSFWLTNQSAKNTTKSY